MKISHSYEEFRQISDRYSHIPLCLEMPGDLFTPVGIYLKIKGESSRSFLFVSALQTGSRGRYSFISFNPKKIIKYRDNKLSVCENGSWKQESSEPISYLRSILKSYNLPKTETAGSFVGGLVGYFSYDSIRIFENIPDDHKNELDLDDFLLMLIDTVIVYDHFCQTISIITLAECGNASGESYENGLNRLHSIKSLIENSSLQKDEEQKPEHSGKLRINSNLTREEFEKMVKTAKEYIKSGDVFQIVLSQRFSIPVKNDSFKIYRCLRGLNPSPYMFYLALDDIVITGSSPEILVKADKGIAVLRPLAGTEKRGKTQIEDKIGIEKLLSDEKEKAEHVMLVDLGRNDLGRFCKFGTVQITDLMSVEKYSHVMHIVSEVIGQVDENKDCFDVLKGCFPAGTVSGAPKIRAMELIDELEKSKRGVYAGTVGYIDFNGNMDSCIAIRTLVIKNDTAYIQAGAGIVADSDPEKEYWETVNKAKALIKAVAMAEGREYDLGDR